uniref:Uncharacterized protein n=1 Tax=Prolemur simus TaxID=1328070 RepID=A0A8C8ZE18_PROSS
MPWSCLCAHLFPPPGLPPLGLNLHLDLFPQGKADFEVLGPDGPVLATVGGVAELWCRLSPNMSAKDMELRWYRHQPSPAVHLHTQGKDDPWDQLANYSGRTAFVSDRVATGEAAVRIHNVTTFDNGTYCCRFTDGNVYSEAALQLQVAGEVPALGHLVNPEAECTSEGWYPEPRVEWTGSRGQAMASVTNLSASATTGLWAVASSVTIEDQTLESVSCSISNPLLPERKVAESHLPSESPFTAREASVPLIFAAVGLVTSAVVCLCWRRWEKNRKHPSLDPDTASAKLSLSEDRKSVTRLFFAQDLPPSPGRFDPDPCVLAQERFSTGRYYWEVEVGDRSAWTLGVCLEDIGRKGRIPKSPQQGLWALELHKKRFLALSYPRTRLRPSKPLRRVGIFLDCDAREISFHNVTDRSQVYRFSGLPFLEPLKPFLCLWTHDPRPVTFCPVVQEMQEETSPPGGPKSHPWRPLAFPGTLPLGREWQGPQGIDDN